MLCVSPQRSAAEMCGRLSLFLLFRLENISQRRLVWRKSWTADNSAGPLFFAFFAVLAEGNALVAYISRPFKTVLELFVEIHMFA